MRIRDMITQDNPQDICNLLLWLFYKFDDSKHDFKM